MWIVLLNNYKCLLWELVRPSCHIKALDLSMSISWAVQFLQSKPPYNGLLPNADVRNSFTHFKLPKVALKIQNPQTFRFEGRWHAIHARIVLMNCQTCWAWMASLIFLYKWTFKTKYMYWEEHIDTDSLWNILKLSLINNLFTCFASSKA